ncbi:MAG: hypothetical protein PHQ66_03770 [Candidatus Nanoarchaeia archaeon]|nr:hypothetical protein [Candidatus Nanoarchaeia archaeon]MDD5358199.1 hypothetical protein [Candidatus Nanoarchaeia archaeon]MDD5588439.1 hypothetical protein [Candidatus Nanoarchaeia archaeon]
MKAIDEIFKELTKNENKDELKEIVREYYFHLHMRLYHNLIEINKTEDEGFKSVCKDSYQQTKEELQDKDLWYSEFDKFYEDASIKKLNDIELTKFWGRLVRLIESKEN